jgi:multiple sugar transport system permease protein
MTSTVPAWRWALVVVAVLPFLVPLLWLLSGVFKPVGQFYAAPPTVLPSPPTVDNLASVMRLLDVPRLIANTLFVALLAVAFTVVSSSLVGFAFATLRARGSGVLFAVLLVSIMVPPAATLVPQFVLFRSLGWVGTYLPLVVPHLFGSAFFIFLFRQWFRNLPPHLFESAELDGANPWQAYRYIAMPLARPALAAVAVFAFIASWNDFLGPLVYLRDASTFTMSLGIASFQGTYVNDVHLAVAAAAIALIPPLLVFVLAQRFLVGGIATSGWRA